MSNKIANIQFEAKRKREKEKNLDIFFLSLTNSCGDKKNSSDFYNNDRWHIHKISPLKMAANLALELQNQLSVARNEIKNLR